MSTNTYVNGRVHVRRRQCETCIYRPVDRGRIIGITDERRDGMQADADADDSCIPCHAHLYSGAEIEPVCRGYWDRHDSMTLALAESMGIIEWVD